MRKWITANSNLLSVLNFLLIIPLAIHAYLGTFSRYLADDYCTAGTLRSMGFIESQVDWYTNWSGRFSFTFTINLAQLIGPALTPFLTGGLILGWILLLTLAIQRVQRGFRSTLPAFTLATLILFSTLRSTPDIYQSLYWQTGLVTYALPLLFLTLYLGWIAGTENGPGAGKGLNRDLLLSGLITFVAGGFSETFVTMQTTAITILLLFKWRMRVENDPQVYRLIGGLVGSLGALIVITIAPGNAIRQGLMPETPGLLALIGLSFRHGLAFVAKSALAAPLTTILSIGLPLMLSGFGQVPGSGTGTATTSLKSTTYLLVAVPIGVYLTIVASIVPSVYATSAYPAERALITAQYALTLGFVLWGFLAGRVVNQESRIQPTWRAAGNAAIIVLAVTSVIFAMRDSLALIPNARTFAQMWDQRHGELERARRAGETHARAPSLPHMGGLAEIGNDPEEWINRCIADAYGLVSITASN